MTLKPHSTITNPYGYRIAQSKSAKVQISELLYWIWNVVYNRYYYFQSLFIGGHILSTMELHVLQRTLEKHTVESIRTGT